MQENCVGMSICFLLSRLSFNINGDPRRDYVYPTTDVYSLPGSMFHWVDDTPVATEPLAVRDDPIKTSNTIEWIETTVPILLKNCLNINIFHLFELKYKLMKIFAVNVTSESIYNTYGKFQRLISISQSINHNIRSVFNRYHCLYPTRNAANNLNLIFTFYSMIHLKRKRLLMVNYYSYHSFTCLSSVKYTTLVFYYDDKLNFLLITRN